MITAGYAVAQETQKAVLYDITTPLKPQSAEASSVQRPYTEKNETFYAENAVDQDPGTRWSSNFSEPQWLIIDLGEAYDIDRVIIGWESAYAASYNIEVSTDKEIWIKAYSTQEGKGRTETVSFKPQKARYIKINCLTRKGQWGFSIWDITVYGKKKLVLF